MLLTQGHASDKATAPRLIETLPAVGDLVADRAYDWKQLIALIESKGGRAHIPTQRDRSIQRSVDRDIYRQRNLIERFFCKLKHFRRIATRFDKHAANFLSAICLAATRIRIRSL